MYDISSDTCNALTTADAKMTIPLGTGLEAKTVLKYKQEWDEYIDFCVKRGWKKVPGRDVRWSIKTIGPYLRWRAKRNGTASIAQIKSKLKHCAICYDYLLPTAKGEGPAKLRLQLAMVSRELAKQERKRKLKAGMPTGPKRSLALGHVAVGMLFSAYGAISEVAFKALPEVVRRNLVKSVCMHTGGMRFQLVRELYAKGKARWSQPSSAYMMAADWDKMKRRTGMYSIKFPKYPKYNAMVYQVYDRNGKVMQTFTAATVLRWHIEHEGSRRCKDLFASAHGGAPSANRFKQWLRASFRMLLKGNKTEVEAMVRAITPHSFRAGMAGDLEREDVSRQTIKKMGRWHSDRAMELYMRDGLAQRLRKIQFWCIEWKRKHVKRVLTSHTKKDSGRYASEGYDESEEESEEK